VFCEKFKLPTTNPGINIAKVRIDRPIKNELRSMSVTKKTELIDKKMGIIEYARILMYFKKYPSFKTQNMCYH
jgi:hypothetical protein